MTAHTVRSIEIKLFFAELLEVSPQLKTSDVLLVTFDDPQFFKSKTGGLLASTTLRRHIPPQISEGALTSITQLQATALGVTAAILPNIVLNVLLGGSLS